MGIKKRAKKAVTEQTTAMEEEEEETEKEKEKEVKEEVEKADNEPQTAVEGKEEEENKSKKIKKKKKKEKKEEDVKVKIETIRELPDKISPLIGYFPSGFDPLKEHKQDPPLPQPRVRVFRHAKRNNRLQLVVSPNGSEVNLVGTNYSGEAATAQTCTYALGVLDKHTQTLKIVPIAANKIFRLEPKLGGSELAENEPSDILKEELTAEERADKMEDKKRDLTIKYSTKKTITKAKKLAALNQEQDSRTREDLDRKIEAIKINKEAFEVAGTSTTNARNIPPHDMSATTSQMAYPLDKIIFKGEWDYLLDILELSQVGAEAAPDVYPSFVCNRIYKLEHIKDEGEKKRLACIFSYISHLIKFKDKHSMDGVSSAKHHKFPSILSQKFSMMFADSNAKRLSDEKKDLLVSYVLVLTLFADDFRTDPSDIAKDLKMNEFALRPHYQHLGCKLVREGLVLLATLPVPLKFPAIKRKRR